MNDDHNSAVVDQLEEIIFAEPMLSGDVRYGDETGHQFSSEQTEALRQEGDKAWNRLRDFIPTKPREDNSRLYEVDMEALDQKIDRMILRDRQRRPDEKSEVTALTRTVDKFVASPRKSEVEVRVRKNELSSEERATAQGVRYLQDRLDPEIKHYTMSELNNA